VPCADADVADTTPDAVGAADVLDIPASPSAALSTAELVAVAKGDTVILHCH
jgi:hypothetical protein